MTLDIAMLSEARVYIAARFSRRPECNQLAHVLKGRGALITSRWVKPDCDHVLPTGLSRQAEDHERQRFALEDVDDVRAANWTISLMEEPRSNTRGGRHIEFGLALAFGHRLTIIGPRETVFHHLPQVEHFETVEAFVASLPTTALRATPSVLAESTSNDCLLVAEAVRERCVEAAEKLVRFDRKNGDEQQRARADAFQAGQRHAVQEIRSLDLSGVGVG